MRWTVGKKLGAGFGVVCLVLAMIVAVNYWTSGQIVKTEERIAHEKGIVATLSEREIDHLNWCNKVNALLTDDNVTALSVETDDHRCKFGQWLYGEERKQTEELFPGIVSLLKGLEAPHASLHASAVDIDKTFVQADASLPGYLAAKKNDHLAWAMKVEELFLHNQEELDVELDHTKCGFGQFLSGARAQDLARSDLEFGRLLEGCKEPHKHLHDSATSIKGLYQSKHEGLHETLLAREIDHLKWSARVEGLFTMNLDRLDVEVDPHRCALGRFLDGEEASALATMDSEAGRMLDSLRRPHAKLHESAVRIQKTYKQIHPGLVDVLRKRLDDHRRWTASVAAFLLLKEDELGVETDPTRCAFGKFLEEESGKYTRDFPELRLLLDKCRSPHEKLHASATAIQNMVSKGGQNAHEDASNIYQSQTIPALAEVGRFFEQAIEVEEGYVAGQKEALSVFREETASALAETQACLKGLIDHAKKRDTAHAAAFTVYDKQTTPALKATGRQLDALRSYVGRNVASMTKANEVFTAKTKPALEAVQDLIGQTSRQIRAKVSKDEEAAQRSIAASKMLSLVFGIIGISAGALLAFFIARGIANPIGLMVTAARRIAEGDLADKVEVSSRDEIGQLADTFNSMTENLNAMADSALAIADGDLTVSVTPRSEKDALGNAFARMVGNLQNVVSQIITTSEQVRTASSDVSTTAQQSSAGAQQQQKGVEQISSQTGEVSSQMEEVSSQIEEMASGIEQASATVDSQVEFVDRVSTTMEEMAASVQSVAENAGKAQEQGGNAVNEAQKGREAVEAATNGMQEISSTIDGLATVINSLGQRSSQIGEIVNTITGIASQTNLLALNAAIEAARAGEHGRGFAVVADEVRKLAERTAQATEEIETLVKGIQDESQNAVRSTEEGIEKVKQGGELTANVGTVLESVVGSIQDTSEAIQGILASADEQSKAAQDVTGAVTELSGMSKQIAKGMAEQSKGAQQISQAVAQTAKAMEETAASVEEISGITNQVAAGAQEMASSAEELSAQSDGMQELMSQFTISNGGGAASASRKATRQTQVVGAKSAQKREYHFSGAGKAGDGDR
jgi:methyl-accepting chemotaxis protein